jgi:hypothetical protein
MVLSSTQIPFVDLSRATVLAMYRLLAHTKESSLYQGDALIGGPEVPRSLFCRIVALIPL